MLYNIPGVFTRVIDKSYIQPLLVEGRSVFIAGFSKFGEDKFYEFGDAETMKFTLGDLDIKRYGLGMMYGLGALSTTRHVIFKRLMPDDADVANLEFMSDGSTESITPLIDSNFLKHQIDQDPGTSPKSLEVKEHEFYAEAGQNNVFWDYNPDNISVFVAGAELPQDEYTAMNGQEIIFNNPLAAGRIVNLYTIFDRREDVAPGDEITFINWQTRISANPGDMVDEVVIPGGYLNEDGDPVHLWCTVNGIDLSTNEYTATNGTSIVFHFSGIPGEGLVNDDVLIVHGVIDNSEFENEYLIYEDTIVADNTTMLHYPSGYNPNITALSVNGLMLGHDDYLAEDGENIYFAFNLHTDDIVRLHTATPGEDLHIWGALIAKAQGIGYNDLLVQFIPAYDLERQFTDEEGDIKYKFNFLKATIFEQIAPGKRTVSNEFTVSLLDKDPVSEMPIVHPITGENLYINNRFAASNEYLEYYLNESLLPDLYKEINIDALTANALGEEGANRLVLVNHITDPNTYEYTRRPKNIEWFVNKNGDFEMRAVSIEGKDKLYTYYRNPNTGLREVYALRMENGHLQIYQEGTTGNVIEDLYVDGHDSFYKVIIINNPEYDPISNPTDPAYDPNNPSFDPNYDPTTPFYTMKKQKYENIRQRLYDNLIGGSATAVWQMQNGSDGDNLVSDGRLDLGYRAPDSVNRYGVYNQNAKQLLLQFYEQNETIHEVLYPELDFDYVPDWTQDLDVQAAIIKFADDIGFTMPLVSLPRVTSPEDDKKQRTEYLYQSSFNTMVYSGQNNDEHYESSTGYDITCPNNYYAMLNHLTVDKNISITEPMANMVKGELPVAAAKLSYIAKSKDIENLRMVQVNTIIKEIQGIYFIDQLTAYKAASKLTRANVVKPIHRMRKDLPRILKDLLQHKATRNIINEAKVRTEKYMSRWQVRDDNESDGIFSEIVVTPVFVQEELKLIISIAVTPIGTIEKIEIPITVY